MQTNVTDEMIARYLSGVASPDEEAAVLDYMSENDDRLDNLLAMTAAIEQNEGGKQRKRVRPLWPAISAAACRLERRTRYGRRAWRECGVYCTLRRKPRLACKELEGL